MKRVKLLALVITMILIWSATGMAWAENESLISTGGDGRFVTLANKDTGRVVAMLSSTDQGQGSIVLGSLLNATSSTSNQIDTITLVNQNDQELSYTVTSDTTYYGDKISSITVRYTEAGKVHDLVIAPAVGSSAAVPIGEILSLTVTADGKIRDIGYSYFSLYRISGADNINTNEHTVRYNNSWYPANEAIVFNYHSTDQKMAVLRWEDVEHALTSGARASFFYIANNAVKYITMSDIAAAENFTSWSQTTSTTNISLNREWKITFNQPVDPKTLAKHIIITTSSGSAFSVSPRIWEGDSSGKTVIVAHDQPFAADTTYKLCLSRHVMPINGSSGLNKGWSLSFTTVQ